MDLYHELIKLLKLLQRDKIDYALCGGLAVALYGYPRFTKDIDVMVRPEDLDRALEAAAKRGFTLSAGIIPFDVGKSEERRVYRVSKITGKDVLPLDLILVTPALEEAWQNRELFLWSGEEIQVVSVTGLVSMKRLAGRDQDLLDIKKLGFHKNEENDQK